MTTLDVKNGEGPRPQGSQVASGARNGLPGGPQRDRRTAHTQNLSR